MANQLLIVKLLLSFRFTLVYNDYRQSCIFYGFTLLCLCVIGLKKNDYKIHENWGIEDIFKRVLRMNITGKIIHQLSFKREEMM